MKTLEEEIKRLQEELALKNEQIALKNEQIVLKNEQIVQFQMTQEVIMDKRLRLYDPEIGTNVVSSRSKKLLVRSLYANKCLFCDREQSETLPLTVAHIISHNNKEDYSSFGPPRYCDPVDLESVRNRILLCGTKSMEGTCHNLFDYHNVCMVYDPILAKYFVVKVVHVSTCNIKFCADGRKELSQVSSLSVDQQPYKRLLAWRMRRCGFKHANVLSVNDLNNFVKIADLSECNERNDDVEDSCEEDGTRSSTVSFDFNSSFS